MVLEWMELENWQNHESLRVEFDPHVTTICGDNDVGKSAIQRALRWVMFDEWDGEANSHISWGEDFSRITLGVDGHEIVRFKRVGKENSYTLDDQEYKAFYPDVPQPIRKLLNCSADNFQNQDDPPFWLSLTSGQAACALNEIFHLTDIDNALEFAASATRKAKAKTQVAQESVVRFKKELNELKWVKKADKALKSLETLGMSLEECNERWNTLNDLIESVEEAETRMAGLKRKIACGEKVLKQGEAILTINKEIADLEHVLLLEVELCRRAKSLSLKQEKLRKWMEGRCPLCGREKS